MDKQNFLLNTWYVACTPDEVQQKPLARMICNIPLVFFRNQDKQIKGLEDYCPHRGAALSLGFVENGQLVCGYHGLRMGDKGKVESMPNQRVENFPCIKAYATVERYGFVWIWPGDQSLVDESLIPELTWATSEDWAYGGGLFNINCDFRLMVDNLMDLTHETYVHASSIGQKEIDEAPVATKMEGKQVVTSRFITDVYAPPFWRNALRANDLADDVKVDRWQECRFDLPSHIMIEVGVAHADNGGYNAPLNLKASSIVVDFITPESDDSIWYFWGMARNFKPHDQELTDSIREGQGKIFLEDLEVLEQQHKNLLRNPDRKVLKLDIDAGGVMARRLIERAIKQEQASSNKAL
ncbi:MAG: aromatic ring-hydroxylating dioxygenase subunit alpha [Aliiglaciecola sp.]|uniref:aromatic ring-hydroxylating dioxygenase subunit alpha n=1 Tax=Aliiglaciecola sp. TaxID=1872441 RepID=UPI003297F77A